MNWKELNPVSKFFIVFIGGLLAFYAFYYSPIYENYIMPIVLRSESYVSNLLLRLLGHNTRVLGDGIASDQFTVSIKGGCDGMEATALYVFAVLAMPFIGWKDKRAGLLFGVSTLVVLNIIRIAGLYLAGIYWPSMFEFLHLHGGVIIFIMISVLLWLIWVSRILNKRKLTT